jgi:ubiquinone/menaquinone biosynthesis C-methylase UbiE
MRRVDRPEILDSNKCSPEEVRTALQTIGRINRWFGGVATTQKMVERAADATGVKRFSLLEVASGLGEVPNIVRCNLERRGVELDVTLLDVSRSHLPAGNRSLVADALRLPFPGDAFDLVSCTLFAHHLNPPQLGSFLQEAFRVCRRAVLINDLVRHPLHLALVYASFPIMGSRIAWLDGLTSVRRAYRPEEIRDVAASAFPARHPGIEISRQYLFRMGIVFWKENI